MQKETVILCLAGIFILLLIPGISGESISISPQISSITAGEETELVIAIDEVPEGLSGYNISVKVENPQVAEIVNISYPEWVAFSYIYPAPPAGHVYMTVSDLTDMVRPGDTGVELGYLTVRGLNQGETAVLPGINKLSAESGSDIPVTLSGATVTVTSGSVPSSGGSSGGGGGGGGSGIFSSSITVVSTSAPATTSTPEKTAGTTVATPVITKSPGDGTPGNTEPIATPVQADDGQLPGGLPWTWIIGAIVIIVVVNLAAVSYYKLRKKS